MRTRRLLGAIAVSLVLHAAVLAFLHLRNTDTRHRAPPSAALEVEILQQNSPLPPAKTKQGIKQPRSADSGNPRKTTRAVPSPGSKSSKGFTHGGVSSAAPAQQSDSPRRSPVAAELFPRGDFLVPPPSDTGSPSGRTLHNEGTSAEEQELARAELKERLTRRTEDLLNGAIASQRVENGMVDTYFSEIEGALKKQLAHPPRFEVPRSGALTAGAATQYAKQAEQFGRTGNPSAPTAPPVSSPAGDGIQDAQPHRFGGGLLAVVELRQGSDGLLVAALLLKSSGNKKFDSYVLGAAPHALEKLAPPPSQGAGIHSTGSRSVWAFEGGLVYLKDIKKYAATDIPYLLGAVPLSILGGAPFDETTGSLGVYDVRDPQFTIDVRLMRVY